MAELNSWDTTAGNNNSAPPDGWPESTMQYSEVNNTAREGMAVVARYHKDTNGSLAAAGSADAYTLTLNAGYSAYFEGMRFRCSIPAENTGASTINVNAIGAETITNQSGDALGAGDLKADGIYEFIYDGTNFQVVGDVSGGSVTADQSIILRADIVTATPPTTEAVTAKVSYYDKDGTDLLASAGFTADEDFYVSNVMHGGRIFLTAEDGSGTQQSLFSGDPAGEATLFNAGITRLRAAASGEVAIQSDGNTDAEGRQLTGSHADGTDRWAVGNTSDGALRVRNLAHGESLILEAENTAGNNRVIMDADSDGGVDLYYPSADAIRLRLQQGGAEIRSNGNTDAEDRRLVLAHQDGTNRALVGFDGDDVATLRNLIHDGPVTIEGEDGAGDSKTMLRAEPGGALRFYRDGDQVGRTVTAANGGLEVDNGNTGGGFERVLTIADAVKGALQSAQVVVNNSTTLTTLTGATITFDAETGDEFIVEVFIGGVQAASGADVKVHCNESGAAAVTGTMIWELVQYDATSSKVVQTQDRDSGNFSGNVGNLETDTASSDPFAIKGYGGLFITTGGEVVLTLQGAQQAGIAGNTTFKNSWLKVTKVA